jgi:subtilisin family serine protease
MGIGGITKPDLSAPGESIFSAGHEGDSTYTTMSGTSMAAPHVTGLVALLFSAKPGLTYDQVKAALQGGCTTDLGRPFILCTVQLFRYRFPNSDYGQGLINARNSVSGLIKAS